MITITGTTLYVGLVLSFFAYSCCVPPATPDSHICFDSENRSCEANSFHFEILRNDLQSETTRRIEIFMEASAYSVENLKQLFSKVSTKYPEPDYLTIVVYTDWSQVDLRTDAKGSASSGRSPGRPHELEFHHAKYFRRGENIYFRYSSELNTERLETFVLQGKALGSPVWR